MHPIYSMVGRMYPGTIAFSLQRLQELDHSLGEPFTPIGVLNSMASIRNRPGQRTDLRARLTVQFAQGILIHVNRDILVLLRVKHQHRLGESAPELFASHLVKI